MSISGRLDQHLFHVLEVQNNSAAYLEKRKNVIEVQSLGQVLRNICRMFIQLSLLLNLYATYEQKKCDLWLHASCYFTQLIIIFTSVSLSLPLYLSA